MDSDRVSLLLLMLLAAVFLVMATIVEIDTMIGLKSRRANIFFLRLDPKERTVARKFWANPKSRVLRRKQKQTTVPQANDAVYYQTSYLLLIACLETAIDRDEDCCCLLLALSLRRNRCACFGVTICEKNSSANAA